MAGEGVGYTQSKWFMDEGEGSDKKAPAAVADVRGQGAEDWWKGTYTSCKFNISYPRLASGKQKHVAASLKQVRATLRQGPGVYVKICRSKDGVKCLHELSTVYTVVVSVVAGDVRVSEEFLSGHAKCALLEYLIRADEDGGYSCR